MSRVRAGTVIVFLVACYGLSSQYAASQAPPQKAYLKFSTGYPAAGSKAGDIVVAMEWLNLKGASRLEVKLFKTENGKNVLVASAVDTTIAKDSGAWVKTFSGLKTGTVITLADATMTGGQAPPFGILEAVTLSDLSVKVP
jgi:hypothetical protein